MIVKEYLGCNWSIERDYERGQRMFFGENDVLNEFYKRRGI